MLIVISTQPPQLVASISLSLHLCLYLCCARCMNVYHLDGSLEIVIMPQNVARLLVDFAVQLSLLRPAQLGPSPASSPRPAYFVLPGVFVIYVTISVNRA